MEEEDTSRKLPATARVIMEIVQATAKLTALEKRVMFLGFKRIGVIRKRIRIRISCY